MEKDKKVTALYCRLSKDDGSNSESLSIRTQKAMLMEYATRNGFGNCQYYVDDGYSGTNSDRPAFQELLDDIRDGKVATVITKDQSRLGRNHIETGTYMEIFFPEHGVRYIAINDGCNGVQREHNKKLNNGLPILHKVPPKRDYGRYFCIMAEKGGTSHGGLTEKLSLFFHAKKQEVNAYGR